MLPISQLVGQVCLKQGDAQVQRVPIEDSGKEWRNNRTDADHTERQRGVLA